MNRSKYDLYNKAIDILGADGLLQVFHVYLIEMLYITMICIGEKTDENERKFIEILSGAKMITEVLILDLKKNNKDQILWTALHSRLDNFKKLIENKERERDNEKSSGMSK